MKTIISERPVSPSLIEIGCKIKYKITCKTQMEFLIWMDNLVCLSFPRSLKYVWRYGLSFLLFNILVVSDNLLWCITKGLVVSCLFPQYLGMCYLMHTSSMYTKSFLYAVVKVVIIKQISNALNKNTSMVCSRRIAFALFISMTKFTNTSGWIC